MSQPLSPAASVITHGLMKKSGHGRDGGYTWAQQYGLPLTKADLTIDTAECPICQRLTLSAWYGIISQGDQQAPCRRLITLDCFHHGRGSVVLIGIDTYSGYRIAFLAHNALAKITMVDLRNALSPLWYFTKHCFWSKNSLQSKLSVALGHIHGIH